LYFLSTPAVFSRGAFGFPPAGWNMLRAIFAAAFLHFLILAPAESSEAEIRVVGSASQPKAVEVFGLSKPHLAELAKLTPDDRAWDQTLALHVLEGGEGANPVAVLGSYAVEGNVLRFTPRFALRPGMKYRVVLRPAGSAEPKAREITKEIAVPALTFAEPPKVTAIYPTASKLPDNQLRFYIHFSRPMRQGEAYIHIKLLTADGRPVNRAFLEIGEELWDGSGQRLTLLLDPGRVKKGLKPREEFGPVLEAGRSYRLVVDKAWRDADGQPLAASFEKRFAALPPIETAVDFKQWTVTSPKAGSREALVVRFDRPLDRALLMRMITVEGAGGKPVAGEIELGEEERRWQFRPVQPWSAGKFNLAVDTALEDSAGNNLDRPFEVDVFDRVDDKAGPALVRIAFAIVK
jgi:hypothetical protein